MLNAIIPLVVYFVLEIIVAAGMIGVSYFLGERHKEKSTPYPNFQPPTNISK